MNLNVKDANGHNLNGWLEPAQKVAQRAETDIIVCGGGPAGVAAALSAAWSGASVTLIEAQGCLGGVWTSGLLSLILDSSNKTGLLPRLLDELQKDGVKHLAETPGKIYDPERMKRCLESFCVSAGVNVRLYTRVCAAYRGGDTNRLQTIVTESKSGREAWKARVFIDATGDGDLAAQAGCGFDIGHPDDGSLQPMTLMGLVAGVRYEDIEYWVHDFKKSYGTDQARLREIWSETGMTPSYGMPMLLRIQEDVFALMANHEYGVSAINADDLTKATMRSRDEIHRLVDALRSRGDVWSSLRLVTTASHIGVREARRIHGRYTVSIEDLKSGLRHPDGICRVTFPVDIHALKGDDDRGYDNGGVLAKPYDIPLHALIAQDVDGLLMAGRCISGDFWAHASYRVTGNAVVLGEAAGACAAIAVRNDVLPHSVPSEDIHSYLAHTWSRLECSVKTASIGTPRMVRFSEGCSK